MRQVKFHNKTVSIGRCKIGTVVSNTEAIWFGHIVAFSTPDCFWIQWEACTGMQIRPIEEDSRDLIIWE